MLEHGSRLKSYKNNGRADLDDLRRRRTESSIELRKQKKDDKVLKRKILAKMLMRIHWPIKLTRLAVQLQLI